VSPLAGPVDDAVCTTIGMWRASGAVKLYLLAAPVLLGNAKNVGNNVRAELTYDDADAKKKQALRSRRNLPGVYFSAKLPGFDPPNDSVNWPHVVRAPRRSGDKMSFNFDVQRTVGTGFSRVHVRYVSVGDGVPLKPVRTAARKLTQVRDFEHVALQRLPGSRRRRVTSRAIRCAP
jgi:hypothetical protein